MIGSALPPPGSYARGEVADLSKKCVVALLQNPGLTGTPDEVAEFAISTAIALVNNLRRRDYVDMQ